MRGQDRNHEGVVEELAECLRADPGFARARQRAGERSRRLRHSGNRVGAQTPYLMLVLGDVAQVREIAIGAHNLHRLRRCQQFENGLEPVARGLIAIAMKTNRSLADQFDEIEDLLALLLADRIAEKAAKQTYVVLQQPVRLGGKFRPVGFFVHRLAPRRLWAGSLLIL